MTRSWLALTALTTALIGCRPHPSSWRPAPGTVAASSREAASGLEAAFELAEPGAVAILQLGPTGRYEILGLNGKASLPLAAGFHRFTYEDVPPPTRSSFASTTGVRGPAAAAGVQCASVQVRNGMVQTGSGFDSTFCGSTGLSVNPYTPGSGAGYLPGAARWRGPVLLIALRRPLSAAEIRAVVDSAGDDLANPAALVARFGGRAAGWAALRPSQR